MPETVNVTKGIADMNIGDRIKSRRIQIGLSQTELADKLGFKSKASISRIEQGVQSLPQSRIIDMARALETSPDYLLGWNDDMVSTTTTGDNNKTTNQITNNYGNCGTATDSTVDPLRVIFNATDSLVTATDIDLAVSYLMRRKDLLDKGV